MYYKLITAEKPTGGLSLKTLWKYRYMLWVFIKSDILSRYSETSLGVLWSLIQPVIGLFVFTFFFDNILKIDTGDMPYPLFAMTGMSAWYYFVFLVNNTGSSLIQMQHIIKKVNFPRILCLLSKAISGLVDFAVAFLLVIALLIFYGKAIPWHIIFLPVILILLIMTGLAAGLWLSSLTVRYRDLHHIVPYLISFAIWVTPVFYPVSIIPEKYYPAMFINPMAGIIEGLRWTLTGNEIPDIRYLVSLIPVFLLFTGGILYFNRMEKDIPELL